MKVLICGSREWANRQAIREQLLTLPKDTIVIEGGARGADRIAKEEAVRLGLRVERYPAEWEKYGKGAGIIRNAQMLREGNPDQVWAFHFDWKNSKGTRDMILRAMRNGKPVTVFNGVSKMAVKL